MLHSTNNFLDPLTCTRALFVHETLCHANGIYLCSMWCATIFPLVGMSYHHAWESRHDGISSTLLLANPSLSKHLCDYQSSLLTLPFPNTLLTCRSLLVACPIIKIFAPMLDPSVLACSQKCLNLLIHLLLMLINVSFPCTRVVNG